MFPLHWGGRWCGGSGGGGVSQRAAGALAWWGRVDLCFVVMVVVAGAGGGWGGFVGGLGGVDVLDVRGLCGSGAGVVVGVYSEE